MSNEKGKGGHRSAHKQPQAKAWTQESPLQQMLLASQSKKRTIPEQESQDLFDLYITPYTNKELEEAKKLQQKSIQDTIILKSGKSSDNVKLFYPKIESQKELGRLKKIIDKKNTVIGELTDELKTLRDQVSSLTQKSHKKINQSSDSKRRIQTVQCNCRKEIQFFQQNNIELFQQLSKCKLQNEKLRKQLENIKLSVLPEVELKLSLMQQKNKDLLHQNSCLLREFKECIKQGKKQMQYVCKMRDILAEKTGIRNLQFEASQQSKSKAREKSDKSKSKRVSSFNDGSCRFSQSESKRTSKQIQKCLSIQMLERALM